MSAHYRCAVTVENIAPGKLVPVANAVKGHWGDFDDSSFFHNSKGDAFEATGEGSVSGTIDIFSRELAIAVWRANEDKCEVTVDTIYMEDLPTDSFHFDESDYIKIMAKS